MKKTGKSVSISPAFIRREEAVTRNAARLSQEILLAIMKEGGVAFPVVGARNMNRLLDELSEHKAITWME